MSTIYDIAKEAGVSPATVSKAFNDYSEVSAKTKAKVLKIAREMGYVPNLTARSLKTKDSYLVGIVFSEDVGIGLEHQFFSVILEACRKKLGSYGYDTVFISKSLGHKGMDYLEHCRYRNVDGVYIITALQDDVSVNKLLQSNIPCVTTDIKYPNTPMIASDNYEGGRQAIKYLHQMGHRKIAHISGPFDTLASSERNEGVKQGYMDVGLDYDETYIIEADQFKYQAAYRATSYLFSRFNESNRPTAIFVSSDEMAIAVMKAIRALGYSVPEDISVIGFDDIQAAEYVTPELTTIRQDKELIGHTVANTLFQLMNTDNKQSDVSRLPISIVERSSVKKI